MHHSRAAFVVALLSLSIGSNIAFAHDDHSHYVATQDDAAQDKAARSTESPDSKVASTRKLNLPADAFKPFSKTVKVRSDGSRLFIESNSLPQHNMMVGIRSWQQQVPLPQPYVGKNAWQIPLRPKLAARPISAKTNLFRGAIAIAVNGVPIFNALNNRKEDAFLAGELDKWGGHCGRGDDYHYHTAPVHLERIVGKGNPIAYALDGFPIYGLTEADGSPVGKLDEFNGQFDKDGNYHYHATKTYPYINGGMRGEVTVRGGQVDPQPRDSPLRRAGEPLRGASITGFQRNDGRYTLEYSVRGRNASVAYAVKNGNIEFEYRDTNGKTRTESYRWSRDRGESLPAGDDRSVQPDSEFHDEAALENHGGSNIAESLTVSSSGIDQNGELKSEFTCDGSGDSPPVTWSAGPEGTVCYALNFWHEPGPGDTKSYWVVYDIPANATSIPRNGKGVGKPGVNDKGRREYDPVCSRGPGTKTYNVTVFALSEQPAWSGSDINKQELHRAINDITLAEGTLTFQYTRSGFSGWLMTIGALGLVSAIVGFAILRRPSAQAA